MGEGGSGACWIKNNFMKRSDFLRSLAAVLVAPSILVEVAESVASDTVGAAVQPPLVRHYRAFHWKVTVDQIQDREFMIFLLRDPRSDFWAEAARTGVDLTKPHEMMMGPCQDDFVRDLQTIVIRQPGTPLPPQPTPAEREQKWREAIHT